MKNRYRTLKAHASALNDLETPSSEAIKALTDLAKTLDVFNPVKTARHIWKGVIR